MKVRVLQMAGQDCEPVSFARLMGELKPIDYSQLAGTVVLDEDEWDEWREDLAHAHEREIEIERKCSADAYFRGVNDATDAVFDSATDDLLAEHGLVRLPVDADGVRIDQEFHIGDKVIRKNGRIGTVIGGAIGKDGKHCLVLSMHDGHWRTYLCPIDEARKLSTGLDFEAEA